MTCKRALWSSAATFFAGVAAWLALCWAGEADEQPMLPAAEPPNSNQDLPQEVIDDIRAIRQRLQIDPLRGTSLELPPQPDTAADSDQAAEDDGGFADALRQTPNLAPRQAKLDPFWQRPPILDRCQADYVRSIRETEAAEPEFVSALRMAGRALDLKAADLEDEQQYQRADRLRRLAQQLRRQARQDAER